MHLGTHWELGNLMGTSWEHIGSKGKKNKNLPCPLQKGKKWTIRECMLSLPIVCMKFLKHWQHLGTLSKGYYQ
jgi:hypothetical protein